ncbi:hypothetical protein ACFX19_020595 [Malus domestica]
MMASHMNSLKIPVILEVFENVKFEEFIQGGKRRPNWRSKREVEMANSKAEGRWDHVPQTLHPRKYRVLRRMQESMVMVPTPCWNPEPICFRTISPERGMHPLPHEDIPFGTPRQLHDFNIIRE